MSTDQFSNKLGQSVGANIRAARQAKKYTQSQLALPDFSVSYISAIERGQIHPSLRALEILAQRLGLLSAELIPSHAQSQTTPGIVMNNAHDNTAVFELELLEAHIYILQGSAAKAVTQLTKLATNKLLGSYLIQHHSLLAWAYLLTSEWQACMNTLAQAELVSNEKNDSTNSLRIHNLMGIAYAAIGDYSRALQTHQHCLTLVDRMKPQDPFFLCQLYYQLGQHYTHLNENDPALEAFQQALAIIEKLSSQEHLQMTYWDIALQYSAVAEYQPASISFYKCIELQRQRVPLTLKSELYHYLCQALIKSDREKAQSYLESVLQRNDNELDTLSQASILTNLAEWHLLNHQLSKAEQYAEKAFELARPSGATLIASDAQIIWGRIDYARAKYEKGDQHFAMGLAMLEKLNMPTEQSDYSALYAQLLDEQGKTKEALKYYKQAYEIQRRAGEYN
jgi:tetratricopeptide (TPR) repeat protein